MSSKLRSIEVTLPWPVKQVKQQRSDAFILAAEQIGRQEVPRVDDSRFTITNTIHPPRRPHGAVVVTDI